MPRKKAQNALAHLGADARARVLSELLDRYPELRREANDISRCAINNVSVETVAEEVADLVNSIGFDELNSRAGKHAWGYVEPSEAAWELLEKAIKGVQDDMLHRFEAGMKPAAEKVCQGIILGLHSVEHTSNGGVLDGAPEFPAEAACYSMSPLLDLYPPRQRRAAGKGCSVPCACKVSPERNRYRSGCARKEPLGPAIPAGRAVAPLRCAPVRVNRNPRFRHPTCNGTAQPVPLGMQRNT